MSAPVSPSPEPQPRPRREWPLAGVAAAIVVFIAGYTFISIAYRKPGPGAEPWMDAQREQAGPFTGEHPWAPFALTLPDPAAAAPAAAPLTLSYLPTAGVPRAFGREVPPDAVFPEAITSCQPLPDRGRIRAWRLTLLWPEGRIPGRRWLAYARGAAPAPAGSARPLAQLHEDLEGALFRGAHLLVLPAGIRGAAPAGSAADASVLVLEVDTAQLPGAPCRILFPTRRGLAFWDAAP